MLSLTDSKTTFVYDEMILFLHLLAIVTTVKTELSEKMLDDAFTQFKTVYNRQYHSPEEDSFRREIFTANYHMIEDHNVRYAKGEVSYSLKMNRFGDMTEAEFKSSMLGYAPLNSTHNFTVESTKWSTEISLHLPKSVDWRKPGAVTPVKDQGNCGSCWAFSATGSLESQIFRKTGKLVSLSEQNLIDCTPGTSGCQGGTVGAAFEYLQLRAAIETEAKYPYKAKEGKCKYLPQDQGYHLINFVKIPTGREDLLEKELVFTGPISVAINSGGKFKYYNGGVYNPAKCDPVLDHAVLAVGYGQTKDNTEYYIVKNSWGAGWGIQGYVLIARNAGNKCGIANEALYPVPAACRFC